MSKRDYWRDWLNRARAEEEKKREAMRQIKPYDPSTMNCERMPFGCWILVALVIWGAFALIMSIFQHHKPV